MKRAKRRYLRLLVEAERMPSEREFIDTIWNSLLKVYGEFGASQSSLALVSYDPDSNSAVIRSSLSALGMVRASLAMITSLAGSKGSIHVLAVSGTVKSLGQNCFRKDKKS